MGNQIYYTWSQEDLDALKAPYQEFMGIDVEGDGKRNFHRAIADDYIALCNESIAEYEALLTIAPVIQQNMRMTVSGHSDPNLSCDNKLIADALMNVIIAPVDEELINLKNPPGDTEYLKMHNQSIAAEIIWNKYSGKTEILDFRIQAKLYSMLIAQLSCDIIGLYDSTGEFYIVAQNPLFSSQAFELTSFKLALVGWSAANPVKQKLIEFPTSHQYQCVHWPMKDVVFGAEEAIKMSVSVTGQNLDIPENFGLTVGLKSVQRETGDPILWTYDIVAEEGSFGAMLHPPEALQDLYEYIPRGFYWFASKYYDHPIVTGQDGELISRTVEEEMALALEINAYVNNTYTYASENTDDWEFMGQGRPAGDCEDFMLTKAQMMIDAGISIQNIKLDCGFPDETSEETFVSGHAWLLYRNQYVMDTSSNSFKTVAEMMVRYPRRRTQISGLTWYCEGFIKTIPVDSLWPTHEVDIKILDFDCYIKKLTR